MKNFRFTTPRLKGWRKIAIASWLAPNDPTVYGNFEINATRIVQRLEKLKYGNSSLGGGGDEKASPTPTITAIVSRAVALTLHKHPALNGMLRLGKISLRPNVSLFLQTDISGTDLTGVLIERAETKSLPELSTELRDRSNRVRAGKDSQFNLTKAMFNLLPMIAVRPMLKLTSFLIYGLNLNLSWLGLPRDPFGSVMITSIGSIGLEEGYAPLVGYSRVPMIVAIGAMKYKPWVLDGPNGRQILPVPAIKLCITFDHRFIDGVYGAKMVKTARHLLESEEGLNELGL